MLQVHKTTHMRMDTANVCTFTGVNVQICVRFFLLTHVNRVPYATARKSQCAGVMVAHAARILSWSEEMFRDRLSYTAEIQVTVGKKQVMSGLRNCADNRHNVTYESDEIIT